MKLEKVLRRSGPSWSRLLGLYHEVGFRHEIDSVWMVERQFGLLALDVVSFHISQEVKALLKSHHITYNYIPPDCTGLVQPCRNHHLSML